MPVKAREYVPQRVLYAYFEGVISLDDLLWIDRWIITSLDQITTPVGHLLLDVRRMTKPQSIQNLRRTQTGRHPKLGWVVLFGNSNPMSQVVLTVAASLFKIRLRYVDTFAEAIHFLQYVDTTLPDLNLLAYRQEITDYIPLDINS